MTASDGVQLFLLGGFELRCRGSEVRVPSGSERVLAFLALHDRPPTRGHVAGTLWPESPEIRALGSLRSALWHLRRADAGLVESYGHHLVLPARLQSDVRELVELAGRVMHRPVDPAILDADITHLGKELLPGYWDSWLVIERERIRQVALTTLERLGELLLQHGRAAEAMFAGLAAVGADPMRETANLLLVRAYLATGNRGDAIRHAARYRECLLRDLSLEPNGQFTAALESGCLRPA
jgi:DNA-binding SARP family transcriptional activator